MLPVGERQVLLTNALVSRMQSKVLGVSHQLNNVRLGRMLQRTDGRFLESHITSDLG
jgi:hypothetical protein